MATTETVKYKFPYRWNLSDGYPAKGIEYHGKRVLGTFVCGGGSTMGYKLAGFDHLGGVEIDPKIAAVYKANHSPKYLFTEDIRAFNQRNDLPAELYDLDLLDGSPPCSSFSMAGNRERDWGKQKQFAEGQAFQRLDDLVFEYVETIKKLQPKVALLENVKGLITGNAKAYAKNLKTAFEMAGYRVQVFLLNAASMGVPQKRERVFFIGQRKDLGLPLLKMEFNEKPILFGIATNGLIPNGNNEWIKLTEFQKSIWHKAKQGESFARYNNGNGFNDFKADDSNVIGTISAQQHKYYHSTEPRHFYKSEFCVVGSYPQDFNFLDQKYGYLIGMSVPPVMTAQIAHQIYLQWLSKIQSP
jgi:DNA (cytosine-5)-methyltransferase 1